MTDELLYEVADQVAMITFNRPDRMNTITPRMLNDLSVRLLEADADRDVRVIVITGNGRAWCAGLDVGVENAQRVDILAVVDGVALGQLADVLAVVECHV